MDVSDDFNNTSLEYIRVEDYQWAKPVRVKRARLDDDERRRRHREGQRQFMQRKRSRIQTLQAEMARLQLHHKILRVVRERHVLEMAQRQLQLELHAAGVSVRDDKRSIRHKMTVFIGPNDAEVMDFQDMETLLVEALLP